MPPVGFEPTISAGERPKTYALDRAATGTGIIDILDVRNKPVLADDPNSKNQMWNNAFWNSLGEKWVRRSSPKIPLL